MKLLLSVLAVVIGAAVVASAQGKKATTSGWDAYGGDAGGKRYSDAVEITKANVKGLHEVWTYHTRALETTRAGGNEAAFEATPVLFGETLFLTTPFDEVIALDARTGVERWRFDPKLATDLKAGIYTSRGVAVWRGKDNGVCAARIFWGTLDARLMALDAATGKACQDFGEGGQVDLRKNLPTQQAEPYAYYGVTSPPTVVGDVVVVGSVVGDNQEVDVEPGVVRGFDVRTGRLVWTWDPIPWARQQKVRTGAGNTWGVISADVEHGLIYLPTSSPSPDFYGGMRPGDDKDADSIVALEAATGNKVWSFQLVHHDLWDYDVAAEPLLFEYRGNIPAVAVTTKMGMVFVFNRLTGEPIYPIEEKPVPKSDVPGEVASLTQPFSSLPTLGPLTLDVKGLDGHTAADAKECMEKLAGLRNEGIYTPPSLGGSLLFPGSLGGVNWGSPAFDPETGVMYANSNREAFEIRLVPRWKVRAQGIVDDLTNWIYAGVGMVVLGCLVRRRVSPGWKSVGLAVALVAVGVVVHTVDRHAMNDEHFGYELSEQRQTPYLIYRNPLRDAKALPCTLPPWGAMTALNLNTGVKEWERPLGTMIEGRETGTVNFGGPVVTAGGLVFAAATRQPLLRAFDKVAGEELWQGKLPVPAQSTPMTYSLGGKQYVVVASGGHGGFGTPLGDSVVAFGLE